MVATSQEILHLLRNDAWVIESWYEKTPRESQNDHNMPLRSRIVSSDLVA